MSCLEWLLLSLTMAVSWGICPRGCLDMAGLTLCSPLWLWFSRDIPPGVYSQVLLGFTQKPRNRIYFLLGCHIPCLPSAVCPRESQSPLWLCWAAAGAQGTGFAPTSGDADPEQPGFAFLAGSAVKQRNVISERLSNKKHGNETAR